MRAHVLGGCEGGGDIHNPFLHKQNGLLMTEGNCDTWDRESELTVCIGVEEFGCVSTEYKNVG
jgi:hypothetical protein